MTAEQQKKKRRFRELVKDDRIRTGRQLVQELEQPYLPLFNDCPDVQRRKAARPAQSVNERKL
jgi:hypothetical protein